MERSWKTSSVGSDEGRCELASLCRVVLPLFDNSLSIWRGSKMKVKTKTYNGTGLVRKPFGRVGVARSERILPLLGLRPWGFLDVCKSGDGGISNATVRQGASGKEKPDSRWAPGRIVARFTVNTQERIHVDPESVLLCSALLSKVIGRKKGDLPISQYRLRLFEPSLGQVGLAVAAPNPWPIHCRCKSRTWSTT